MLTTYSNISIHSELILGIWFTVVYRHCPTFRPRKSEPRVMVMMVTKTMAMTTVRCLKISMVSSSFAHAY